MSTETPIRSLPPGAVTHDMVAEQRRRHWPAVGDLIEMAEALLADRAALRELIAEIETMNNERAGPGVPDDYSIATEARARIAARREQP